MNSSGRKRILRGRIERGEYVPKKPLLKVAVVNAGAGLLQRSKSFRKDLTQAYIEDAFQRTRLPPKVRDSRWAFNPAANKAAETIPASQPRDALDLMFAD